jgi:ADP-ribose pyrophosphatase YjhB (NUDIX family)
MKPVPTVAVLILKDNKVLLVKHKKGAKHPTDIYGLPSGRIEEGESDKKASIRELKEETGLETSEENLREFSDNLYFAKLERKDGKNMDCSWHVLLCNAYGGKIKESSETIPQWIEVSRLDEYWLLPNIKNAVEAGIKFLEKQKGD